MRLLRSRNPRNSSDGVSQIEFNQGQARPWPMLFAALAAALVIALVLFYGGRWAYRSIFNDEPAAPVVQQPRENNTSTQPGVNPQPSTPQAGSQTTTPSTGSSSELPNSGPGEVAALFVMSSLAAAGIYYVYQLRRYS